MNIEWFIGHKVIGSKIQILKKMLSSILNVGGIGSDVLCHCREMGRWPGAKRKDVKGPFSEHQTQFKEDFIGKRLFPSIWGGSFVHAKAA